jgi:hypothetical protein
MKMAKIFSLPCRAETGIAGPRAKTPPSSRQTYSTMRGKSWPLINGDRNVIRFRPRANAPRHELSLCGCDTRGHSPIGDLRKYEYAREGDDDYHHRMLVNFLATIVVILLMVTGSWLVDRIISSWP